MASSFIILNTNMYKKFDFTINCRLTGWLEAEQNTEGQGGGGDLHPLSTTSLLPANTKYKLEQKMFSLFKININPIQLQTWE